MITQPNPLEATLAYGQASAFDPGARLLSPDGEVLFRQLVTKHQHRLYRFVVKHIGWGSDAEDITQQAFVEAAQSYATFKGESELSTWLYPGNPDGRIEVQAWRDGDMLLVLIRDQAPAFNPLLVPLPDTQASIEERAIGGLGLMFVRRTADSLEYRRTADGNEVIFGKRQVQ